ncbi:Rve domain-containing protein [Quillaja saponaria]|uniref:Rve domain-containing protein n=1 Tax=Quillaja saponaria TaxID=32244 RepID=A0AAD7M658_QUISA|nr:Rve domain-containing protein [Quillaja saponaria]
MEAVIPVEIRVSSPRVKAYSEESNETEIRSNLDLLNEVREKARLHHIVHQQTTAQHFNDKVKLRPLQVGNFVLRLNQFKSGSSEGKLKELWEGDYKKSLKLRSKNGQCSPSQPNDLDREPDLPGARGPCKRGSQVSILQSEPPASSSKKSPKLGSKNG